MPLHADRLRDLRKNKGLTQKQIADIIGTVERNYRRYEAGTADPTLSYVEALAEYYNVSIDYLAGRTGSPKINR